jgi:hypothetical protein
MFLTFEPQPGIISVVSTNVPNVSTNPLQTLHQVLQEKIVIIHKLPWKEHGYRKVTGDCSIETKR